MPPNASSWRSVACSPSAARRRRDSRPPRSAAERARSRRSRCRRAARATRNREQRLVVAACAAVRRSSASRGSDPGTSAASRVDSRASARSAGATASRSRARAARRPAGARRAGLRAGCGREQDRRDGERAARRPGPAARKRRRRRRGEAGGGERPPDSAGHGVGVPRRRLAPDAVGLRHGRQTRRVRSQGARVGAAAAATTTEIDRRTARSAARARSRSAAARPLVTVPVGLRDRRVSSPARPEGVAHDALEPIPGLRRARGPGRRVLASIAWTQRGDAGREVRPDARERRRVVVDVVHQQRHRRVRVYGTDGGPRAARRR